MKRRILVVIMSLGILLFLGIGLSYSMWNMSNSQDTNNVIATTSECFDVSLTNQSNAIKLENAYPITDEKGKKLTPFTFTVKNTCDMFLSYTVNLESLDGSTLSSKFIDAMVNNEEIKRLSEYESTDVVNKGSVESRILAKGSLSKDDSNDYSLRLWIDYDTTMEDLDNETKILKSKVVIKATASTWDPVSEGYNTLHDAILANEYQMSPEKALKKINAKGTPDFSETAPIISGWVEKHGDIQTATFNKPHPKCIGKEEYGTQNLTAKDSLLLIGKGYTFNSSTGQYSLTDTAYYDPTNLDLENNDYYFCNGMATIGSDGVIVTYDWSENCNPYKLTNVEKIDNYDPEKGYQLIWYKVSGYRYTQQEIESDSSDKGLYIIEDDLGTSYYYRGNVKNNNVYFAGMYWQIIRINGDGSIRLLYNGTEKDAQGDEKTIASSAYNPNMPFKPAYGGYMYGSDLSTLANASKNEVDSKIKSTLDNYIKQNEWMNKMSNYLADTGFCNDRRIHGGDGISTSSNTYYNGIDRDNNKKVTLTCDSNDLFTVSSNNGNGALTYPVGLITYDELVLSGLTSGKLNKLSWTYSSKGYWTMTPLAFKSTDGNIFVAMENSNGNIVTYAWSGGVNGIRPVINLKSNVKISGGIGTVNNPFVVE